MTQELPKQAPLRDRGGHARPDGGGCETVENAVRTADSAGDGPTNRLTMRELTERAARGVGKVGRLGLRGATQVSLDEVEAMALLLAVLWVPTIHAGSDAPSDQMSRFEGEPT